MLSEKKKSIETKLYIPSPLFSLVQKAGMNSRERR